MPVAPGPAPENGAQDAPGGEPPSGAQWTISAGGYDATVVEVGGGIRTLRAAGVDVLDGYRRDERCPSGRGQILAPWPNRLRDGRWSYGGEDQQLPLTEPRTRTAIHGLLRWQRWQLVAHRSDEVALAARLPEQPGWPQPLTATARYGLSAAGLNVELGLRNTGRAAVGVGLGMHPYLATGGLVDDCVLDLPATSKVVADDRGLPLQVVPTPPLAGHRIGTQVLDTCYGDLRRDPDGLARVRLARPDGAVITLWVDETWPWLMVFSADTVAPQRRRRGLAVEPMTCPPNALASGEDLVVLAPGQLLVGRFGIEVQPVTGGRLSR